MSCEVLGSARWGVGVGVGVLGLGLRILCAVCVHACTCVRVDVASTEHCTLCQSEPEGLVLVCPGGAARPTPPGSREPRPCEGAATPSPEPQPHRGLSKQCRFLPK